MPLAAFPHASARSSGVPIRGNGRASLALWYPMQPATAAMRSSSGLTTASLGPSLVSFQRNPSTPFVQDAEVGAQWN